MATKTPSKSLNWEISISLITNPFMIRMTVKVCLLSGLIMAGLLSFIFLVMGNFNAILPILEITGIGLGIIFVIAFFVMAVILGNRMPLFFHIDPDGVVAEVKSRTAKTSNRLAIILGLFARKPGVVGSGLIGLSQETTFVGWSQISRIQYYDTKKAVVLKNSWRSLMIIYCTAENYLEVKEYIRSRAKEQKKANPLLWIMIRTLLTLLACIPLFAIDYPFNEDLFLAIFIVCFALATIWLIPLFGYVVIGALFYRLITMIISGMKIHKSSLGFRPDYRGFEILNGDDFVFLIVLGMSMAYLVWMSIRCLQGKDQTALFSD